MSLMDDVKRILRDTLVLDNDRVEKLDTTSPLLGNIIELDSVGVVSVLTAIEEEYGIVVEDDEISSDVFTTLGSLIVFLVHKIGLTRISCEIIDKPVHSTQRIPGKIHAGKKTSEIKRNNEYE